MNDDRTPSERGARHKGFAACGGALIAVLFTAVLSTARALALPAPAEQPTPLEPAVSLQATLPLELGELVAEILSRNPDLARLRAEAEAAEHHIPQMSALPDPMASVTAFVSSPETRVGPQVASATISQRLPWLGKLRLKEQRAILLATARRLDVEAKGLELLTEARRIAWELAYHEAEAEAVREDRSTLSHFEELARARYASGVGPGQTVVKLQAEITRDDSRLLRIEKRRVSLLAALNALRDRPATDPIPAFHLTKKPPRLPSMEMDLLLELAQENRPEVARARVLTEAAGLGVQLAEKAYRPDLTVGLGYTVVGDRKDAAGRAMPPAGNGNDIIGLTVGVNLPIRRDKLAAGVLEASAREAATRDLSRGIVAKIETDIGEIAARLPLTVQEFLLFDDLLLIQAEEALRSAETAYASGAQDALDLLDAERVLLDVRTSSARSLADSLILLARLEGVLGVSSQFLASGETP